MSRDPKRIPSVVKNRQLVEKRRQQIIRGACDLFVRKGFHRTTTREIARECGLSIGTMYEYIQSKEDVLYLVCDHIHSELESRLKSALAETGTGREGLTEAIAQHFRVMAEMSDDVLLIYQETKSLPGEAMSYVLKKEEEITSLFEEILQRHPGRNSDLGSLGGEADGSQHHGSGPDVDISQVVLEEALHLGGVHPSPDGPVA